MTGNVNKPVRFVNIITDISQHFIDIYQSLYKHIYVSENFLLFFGRILSTEVFAVIFLSAGFADLAKLFGV
jgi:hypothetical protein